MAAKKCFVVGSVTALLQDGAGVSLATADGPIRAVDPTESKRIYRDHVAGRLDAEAAVCLYTVTPDRGFIIDARPEQDRVTIVSACILSD